MIKLGIWIDKEKAHIVSVEGEVVKMKTVFSNLDFFNPRGGSRSKTRWGPQDVVQDSKYLEKEKQQLKQYFGELAAQSKKADCIVVFGPAETGRALQKEWEGKYNDLARKIKAVKTADSMTDNQVMAWVRDFYT
ncbi:hypothetical protein [Eudoraea chungangensis]|uniref:hypothetical protein n=1 Tax=Eudoraea chungangensis TaxID=1481905 RepID=UPI0023EBF5DC|nr:hypothetical protein [Eudoraea chungangensis]